MQFYCRSSRLYTYIIIIARIKAWWVFLKFNSVAPRLFFFFKTADYCIQGCRHLELQIAPIWFVGIVWLNGNVPFGLLFGCLQESHDSALAITLRLPWTLRRKADTSCLFCASPMICLFTARPGAQKWRISVTVTSRVWCCPSPVAFIYYWG